MDRVVMGAVYLLGSIGFAGITLIPLRSFVVIRHLAGYWNVSVKIRLLITAFAAFAMFLLFAEASLLIEISRCLLGARCGPKRISGWMRVANIGFWYVMLELVAFIIGRTVGKMAAHRTSASGR